MKKRNPILGIVCLLILCGVGAYVFLAGAAKAEITIDGKTYEMRTMTVREFMGDDYVFAVMSQSGNSIYTFNYSDATLEAKSYYNMAVPFKLKGGYGAPIECWLYNSTPEEVEIREAKINAIACNIPDLLEDGVKVSVAGVEMGAQSKTEIKEIMDDTLKGYTFQENEDYNFFSYTKGQVSYSFTFDNNDVLLKATARNNV